MILTAMKQTAAMPLAAVVLALAAVAGISALWGGSASADQHCVSEGGIFVCNSDVTPEDSSWPVHGSTPAERARVAQALADLACETGLGWQTRTTRVVIPAQPAIEAQDAVEAQDADPGDPFAEVPIPPTPAIEARPAIEGRPAVPAVTRTILVGGLDIPGYHQRFNIEYRHVGTRFESGPHVQRTDDGRWQCRRDGSRQIAEIAESTTDATDADATDADADDADATDADAT